MNLANQLMALFYHLPKVGLKVPKRKHYNKVFMPAPIMFWPRRQGTYWPLKWQGKGPRPAETYRAVARNDGRGVSARHWKAMRHEYGLTRPQMDKARNIAKRDGWTLNRAVKRIRKAA